MTEDDAQRIRDAVASIAPGVWGIDIAGTVKTIAAQAAEVERLKAENDAMREIVQFVAGCDIGPMSRRLLMWQYDDADVYVTKARAILAENENERAKRYSK